MNQRTDNGGCLAPGSIIPDRGEFLYMDSFGTIWRLRPQSDPHLPLLIVAEHRRDPGISDSRDPMGYDSPVRTTERTRRGGPR